MMIDIDYFKLFNDNYGHLKGDDVIYSVSELLKQNCRKSDIIIRYGGEEFRILLPNTSAKDCEIIAKRIISKINELSITHDYSRVSNNITLSIGIASNTIDNLSEIDELLSIADNALYKAKSNGRNQFSYALKKQIYK